MSGLVQRIAASPLGAAARRLFTGDRRIEDDPPEDEQILPTVFAAAGEEDSTSPAAYAELKEENSSLRNEMDDVTSQLAALHSLMLTVNDRLDQIPSPQQQPAAAPPLQVRPRCPEEKIDAAKDAASPECPEDEEEDQPDSPEEDRSDSSDDEDSTDSTDSSEDDEDETGDHCPEAVICAIDLECHIGALQTLLWYTQYNKQLHSERDKRVTVNSATLYDFIAKNRPEVIVALQTAIAEPGPHIQQAVNAFTAAVASGHRKVDKCSISGLLLEAYSRAESEAVAEDARGLVANAVFRSRELSALEAEVNRSGIFDRELSEGDFRVASLEGFQDFDPATAAGRDRWIQLQRIFTAYF